MAKLRQGFAGLRFVAQDLRRRRAGNAGAWNWRPNFLILRQSDAPFGTRKCIGGDQVACPGRSAPARGVFFLSERKSALRFPAGPRATPAIALSFRSLLQRQNGLV
jgi:hypothetical protein